ncbi:hypothetical protein DOI34_26400 [Salmonella enterica subsp. enterica serovar Virchow]|nr:hypothetical protein [Salmonella enterica subsp. enterica serovar Virchow]
MVWTPDKGLPFFRLTETTLSVPSLAPAGKSIITCDIGCEVGDRLWTMPEDQLVALCLRGLEAVLPGVEADFLKSGGVMRTPVAYPVYLKAYEEERLGFAASTGVDGLYSVGRNGEFAHILMEDVYWRTLKRMEAVKAYVGSADRASLAPSISDLQSVPERPAAFSDAS